VFNAQRGGAIAAFIYNSVAGGDNIQAMGPGAHAGEVTIASWFLRRSDGLNMRDFANAHAGAAEAEFVYAPQPTANVGDIMAGFSSRGPSQDKLIKPDVAAPGVDVLSSGYGDGAFPGPFIGFGSASGTSMATPHVAGSAALLRQLHPSWTPAQIKSALMTTATESVWLDTAKTALAGVLDRGAGRIDLTKAGTPGLTVDRPSLSAGELAAGQSVDFTIRAKDVSGDGGTWNVSAVKTGGGSNFEITPALSSITVASNGATSLAVHIAASAAAAPGSYEGKIVLDNAATGRQLHVPVWLRVLPTNPTADVLLVDDDGSDAGFTDYSTVYTSLFTSLGVSYQYVDPWNDGFPSFFDLFGYKAVVIFTGDNDSFDTSGFFPSDQNALTEWLDSGDAEAEGQLGEEGRPDRSCVIERRRDVHAVQVGLRRRLAVRDDDGCVGRPQVQEVGNLRRARRGDRQPRAQVDPAPVRRDREGLNKAQGPGAGGGPGPPPPAGRGRRPGRGRAADHRNAEHHAHPAESQPADRDRAQR
jgi:hypothetical protein